MQKRQQINLQQDYNNQNFLEPEDLDTDQSTPVQYQSMTEEATQVTNSNSKPASQQIKASSQNSINNNGTNSSQFPKPVPAKKPTSSQRSSLQQQTDSQQQIRNSLILQFKISQLQKICTTLTSANQKLLDKIQQLQQQNQQYKQRITILEQDKYQKYQQNNYTQSLNDSRQSVEGNQSVEGSKYERKDEDESQLLAEEDQDQKLLEDQVGDIELMIKEYRQELTNAEELNKNIKESLTQKITQLEDQLSNISNQLASTQTANLQLQQQLIETQQKNEALQRQIQSLIHSSNHQANSPHEYYYQDPTARNRTQSRSSQYMTPVHRANYHNQRVRPSYYDQEYSQQQNSQFDSSVQLQLQKLIQKLVNELQHQRSVKKRMTEEMKRIQKDLLENEKQIMLKNKKIYELEMNLLKGEKNHLFNNGNTPLSSSQIQQFNNQGKKQERGKYSIFSPSREQLNGRNNYNSPNNKDISPKIRDKYLQQQRQRINTSAVNYSPPNRQLPVSQAYTKTPNYPNISRNPNISQSPSSSAQTKHLQTFSLLQLLNEPTITLTVRQKLHISLKLVQFYEQKIYQHKNYTLLMLENVLVTNFNRIKLGLVKIRVQEHKRSDEGNQRMRKNSRDQVADGPEKVVWNLGFLLNSLLLDVPTKEGDLGSFSAEQNVLETIDNILDNRSLNREVFSQLRDSLDVALKQRVK